MSCSDVLLWFVAITSFWITRLINPLGIKAGDWPNYVIPPTSFNINSSEALVKIVYFIGETLFFSEIFFSFFLFLLIYKQLFNFYNQSSTASILIKVIITTILSFIVLITLIYFDINLAFIFNK